MSLYHKYDPHCPDCTPAWINMETGEVYPKDHPIMITVMKVWWTAPFREREAYINVTTSTDGGAQIPHDVETMAPLVERMRLAVGAMDRKSKKPGPRPS